jgi:hypothetical protein
VPCLDAVAAVLVVPTHLTLNLAVMSRSSSAFFRVASSLRVDRLQLLNSLLAVTVTETDNHLEDVTVTTVVRVTHDGLQVRHDKLRPGIECQWHSSEAVFDVWPPKTGRASQGKRPYYSSILSPQLMPQADSLRVMLSYT